MQLPPVDLVSNGTIAAQDINACDEKVDIWALGVTLFELLTGRSHLYTIFSFYCAVQLLNYNAAAACPCNVQKRAACCHFKEGQGVRHGCAYKLACCSMSIVSLSYLPMSCSKRRGASTFGPDQGPSAFVADSIEKLITA